MPSPDPIKELIRNVGRWRILAYEENKSSAEVQIFIERLFFLRLAGEREVLESAYKSGKDVRAKLSSFFRELYTILTINFFCVFLEKST